MVRTLLDYLIEGYLLRIDRLAPLLSDSVDVVLLNDDLGTQNGPMLALATYRELIKPYQKILFTHVKRKFGRPILFHSCGAVREFIPDLIDVGVDALNPVQLSANGMDARVLKHDFGNYMSFWGGGVDTQTVLNKSTPSEVADSVRRNVEIFAPGGGFVFCQVHNIQPDVPPENVVAMYKALDEYGGY
jgi:uroporphyrinogen decarboxylase